MRKIDERLLDPRSEVEIAENFNRVLALVDEASGRVRPRGDPRRRCRMMRKIDERLLDPRSEVEIAENFNRVLALVDEASGVEGPAGPQGEPGPQGDPGPALRVTPVLASRLSPAASMAAIS